MKDIAYIFEKTENLLTNREKLYRDNIKNKKRQMERPLARRGRAPRTVNVSDRGKRGRKRSAHPTRGARRKM